MLHVLKIVLYSHYLEAFYVKEVMKAMSTEVYYSQLKIFVFNGFLYLLRLNLSNTMAH